MDSEVPTPRNVYHRAKKILGPGEESLQGLINYQRDLKMIADWFINSTQARGEDEALGYPDTHTPAMDLRDLG